jgi:hypothetical protein
MASSGCSVICLSALISVIPSAGFSQAALTCGQTVDASLGELGEQDLYTFTGTVGVAV